MSVDITGWHQLDSVAESIRSFLNAKLASITLPEYIQCVSVIACTPGSTPPEVEIRDISDPFPEFYEEDEPTTIRALHRSVERTVSSASSQPPPYSEIGHNVRSPISTSSHLHYFHPGFSAHLPPGPFPLSMWGRSLSSPNIELGPALIQTEGAITPPSSPVRPAPSPVQQMLKEPKDDDLQIVAHIKYNGDLVLELTAELILNHPSPSFVVLPVRIRVTGLEFDGEAVLAYVSQKVHFCLLDEENGASLLRNVHVESEIGEKQRGILKNVGNVEKFILEQLRRILDEDLIFPSFWTFVR